MNMALLHLPLIANPLLIISIAGLSDMTIRTEKVRSSRRPSSRSPPTVSVEVYIAKANFFDIVIFSQVDEKQLINPDDTLESPMVKTRIGKIWSGHICSLCLSQRCSTPGWISSDICRRSVSFGQSLPGFQAVLAAVQRKGQCCLKGLHCSCGHARLRAMVFGWLSRIGRRKVANDARSTGHWLGRKRYHLVLFGGRSSGYGEKTIKKSSGARSCK